MPTPVHDDWDSPLYDPDELKMPESPRHRRTCDLIGLVAANLLGSDHDVFRDMNWYPDDGGGPMAPDVMVLPAGAVVASAGSSSDDPVRSYQQNKTGGPTPSVVVEIPSSGDGFLSLLAKAYRCQQLGAVVYLVSAGQPRSVFRIAPQDPPVAQPDPEGWVDRPIPELGGLRIGFEGDDVVVTQPDGTAATSDEDLLADTKRRATDAEDRAEALARQLRELGVEPDG